MTKKESKITTFMPRKNSDLQAFDPKNDPLKQRILDNLKDKKPIDPNVYKIWDAILFGLIVGLIFVASFSFGFFWWDFRQNSDFLGLTQETIWELLPSLLLEVLILIGVLSAVTYFLYRKSDFWWVKKRIWLIVIFWILVVVIGGGLAILAESQEALQNQYQTTGQNLNQIPFRPRRLGKAYQNRLEKGFFPGRVESIKNVDQDKAEIVIKNPNLQKTFVVDKKILKNIKKGDFVEAVLDPQNLDIVLEIKKIKPSRKPPI